jgi:hypothetical protein
MSVDFIPPVLEVLRDRQVTTAEIQWLATELLVVTVAMVAMTTFWELVEEDLEW